MHLREVKRQDSTANSPVPPLPLKVSGMRVSGVGFCYSGIDGSVEETRQEFDHEKASINSLCRWVILEEFDSQGFLSHSMLDAEHGPANNQTD